MGEITSDGNHDPSLSDYAQNINYLRNWTPAPQSAPFRWNTPTGVTRGTFGPSAGYDYINPFGQGSQSTGSRYTVRDGDTLQGIATSVWGDASLWYLIAEANGMAGGSALIAGQSLILPDRVTNVHNNSGVFKVYDPNAALGDLSPTSAKPPKKPGACAVVGQIMMVVIAVAVSIYTAGALAGPTATLLGSIGAGAAGGIAGSVASQAFGMATGLQSKFNWKGVAMAAIGGAIGGGIGKFGELARAGDIGGNLGKVGSFLGQGGFVGGSTRGLVGSLLSQGIGLATGLKDRFEWSGVAAAGLGGGFGSAFGEAIGAEGLRGNMSFGNILANAGSGAANGLANAAARSLIKGTSFGDNLLAALPDVIGSTLGNLIAGGVLNRADQGAIEKERAILLGRAEPLVQGRPEALASAKDATQTFATSMLGLGLNAQEVSMLLADAETQQWILHPTDIREPDAESAPAYQARRSSEAEEAEFRNFLGDQQWQRYYNGLIRVGGGENAGFNVGPFRILGGTLLMRVAVSLSLDRVLSTPRGEQMRARAAQTSRTERIILTNGTGQSRGNFRLATVVINTNPAPFVRTTHGVQRVPMPALLAHELGHMIFNTEDDGPGQMNNVRLNENPVRRALGLPLRTHYGPDLGPNYAQPRRRGRGSR